MPPTRPTLKELPVQSLLLDRKNPRLPDGVSAGGQAELLRYIERTYDPIEVGRSIADHGYFLSEPLIVMRSGARHFIVLEGNRRLVALRLLADPGSVPDDSDNADEWTELARRADVPKKVPSVIVASRRAVAPIIGFRHISGIQQWDPFAKARFIASFVDEKKQAFDEVAMQVGGRPTAVRGHYRNFAVVRQAETDFGLDAERVKRKFGVFTRAMTNPGILTFVGAPAAPDVVARAKPLPETKRREVRELFGWLYGEDGVGALITDSRQVDNLGRVLASAEGLAALRRTRDLDAALAAAGGLKDRLIANLQRAKNNLEAALLDASRYAEDPDVSDLIAACEHALRELRKARDEG